MASDPNSKWDFGDVDGIIQSGATIQALIAYEDEQTRPTTQVLPPRPPKQDVSNPTQFEQVPSFGDIFGQGDFSGGSGQLRYHSQDRDPEKYLYSENVDILKPGRLRCLHDATATAFASANIGKDVEVANDLPFCIDNTPGTIRIKAGDGNFPGTWTSENPLGATGKTAANIEALASSGSELYVALGTSGVNVRSAAGTYTNYVSAGATAVDRIAWLKDRLICSDGQNIYEITTVGNVLPTPIDSIPLGQRFEAIWEYGAFIYAAVISTAEGQSSIHHYGLNQALTGLEFKGQTDLPDGELCYSGIGYLGGGYLGAGRTNGQGGATALNGLVYQCVQDAAGFLQIYKLAEDQETGTSANRAVRCFAAFGESMLMGWCNSSQYGANRSGLAIHHLARDAFAPYLQANVMGTPATEAVTSVTIYRGRVLFVRAGVGLYFENLTKFVSGKLVSSGADFNNAGSKIWDKFDIAHIGLASGEEIDLSYSIDDGVSFTQAIANSTLASKGTSVTISSNIRARQLILQIDLKVPGGGATTPEFKLFSVRSNSSPPPEFVLTRNFRLFEADQKEEEGQEIFGNPDNDRATLEALVFSWVTFKESNKTWSAFLMSVSDISLGLPQVRAATGDDPSRKGYVIQLQMIAS